MGMTETASRLIARHGQAATLLRPGPGTTDGFGGYTPGPATGYPATILTATYAEELQYIAAGWMSVGDQRVLLSTEGLTIDPVTTDRLQNGGVEYRILRVSPLAPAGTVIFWELQVRHV